MSRSYRVEILTEDLGIVPGEPPQLASPLQAVRVLVSLGAASRVHMVVRAGAPPWRLDDEQAIRARYPAEFVSCTRAEGPGRVVLSCASGSDQELEGAAAAVATLKRAWGWDESPLVRVELAHPDLALSVDPRFEDGVWTVLIV